MEIFIHGKWGVVCGFFSWDTQDSKVVCQQLGYEEVNSTDYGTPQSNVVEDTGWSWQLDLMCTGSETNLMQCPHGGVELGCPQGEDVSIVCNVPPDESE